jgi:hypothetical protein
MAGEQKLPGEDSESFKKLKALRESGYTGPVDQNGNKVTSGRAADILKALRDRT